MTTETLIEQQAKPKRRSGFAAMTPEQRREIASKGGKAATNRHQWTQKEASKWGKVGGAISKRRPRHVA